MGHSFFERLAQGPILADGAMGIMLHVRGARLNQCLDTLNLEQPDRVREVLGVVKDRA